MRRRLMALMLLLLPVMAVSAQEDRPKVAVVLSGGGAKGVAHSGVLRIIEQAGIPIDIITGTSMGSLIGALYSIGYTTDQIDSIVLAQDWMTLLSDRTDPKSLTLRGRQEQNTYVIIRGFDANRTERGGAIRGRNIMHLFRTLCHPYLDSIHFDQLPIRYACVATDIITNDEVDIHSGRLIQAMRASMAIPGAFTPVRWGERVLVDGGLKNNYPADVARAMGADIVIGVSVQAPPITADDITDAASVLNQIVTINCRNKLDENIALSDIFIQVDVEGFSSTSYSTAAVDSLIHRGREAALTHWDDLLALRRRHGIDSVGMRPAVIYPMTLPSANTSTRPVTRVPIGSVGFRFDTEEMGAILLGAKLPLSTRTPIDAALRIRLGRRLSAHGEVSLITRQRGFNPTLGYTFANNDLDIYSHGSRAYNVRYRTQTVDFTPLDLHFNRYDIHAGIRWDYYDYYGHLLAASGTVPQLDDEYYFTYHFQSLLNTENDWYFPTAGARFNAQFAYHTTNFIGFRHHTGIADALLHWRINLSLGSRTTLQPMVYARALVGEEVPLAFINAIGGEGFGQYVEQQLPFAGIGHVETAYNYLAATQLQLQFKLFDNHYLLLRTALAMHTDSFAPDLFNTEPIYGVQAGYTYNTFFGPVSARIGYSNRTAEPYLYISIGHIF